MPKQGRKPSVHARFLKLGKDMQAEPLDTNEQRIITALVNSLGGRRAFKVGQCFMNAQRLISHDMGRCLKYHEGYFVTTGVPIPILHAWCSINGKVVDLTFEALKKLHGRENETAQYFGIEVPYTLVTLHMLDAEVYAPVIEHRKLGPRVFGIKD